MAAPVDLELKKVKEGFEAPGGFSLVAKRTVDKDMKEAGVLRKESGFRELGDDFLES